MCFPSTVVASCNYSTHVVQVNCILLSNGLWIVCYVLISHYIIAKLLEHKKQISLIRLDIDVEGVIGKQNTPFVSLAVFLFLPSMSS